MGTSRIAWADMRVEGIQCMSNPLLSYLENIQRSIAECGAYDYQVLHNYTDGVFSLGGDLAYFINCIEEGSHEKLKAYADKCVELIYKCNNSKISTIALVDGKALGGGFEAALSCDIIVAEEQATFSFPETLFRLFPGMGAYSFLARRTTPSIANEIINGGRTYTAEKLSELGVVDILTCNGGGLAAVRKVVTTGYSLERCEVSIEELRAVSAAWAGVAMRLSTKSIRTMKVLLERQRSKLS